MHWTRVGIKIASDAPAIGVLWSNHSKHVKMLCRTAQAGTALGPANSRSCIRPMSQDSFPTICCASTLLSSVRVEMQVKISLKSSPGTAGTLRRPNKKLRMLGRLEMASTISSWASPRDVNKPTTELLKVQRRDC
jgi:hypothetical protein